MEVYNFGELHQFVTGVVDRYETIEKTLEKETEVPVATVRERDELIQSLFRRIGELSRCNKFTDEPKRIAITLASKLPEDVAQRAFSLFAKKFVVEPSMAQWLASPEVVRCWKVMMQATPPAEMILALGFSKEEEREAFNASYFFLNLKQPTLGLKDWIDSLRRKYSSPEKWQVLFTQFFCKTEGYYPFNIYGFRALNIPLDYRFKEGTPLERCARFPVSSPGFKAIYDLCWCGVDVSSVTNIPEDLSRRIRELSIGRT
ncbi:MAG: hypothetical protein A3F09_00660 [Chlamydiae bacterium RIFCSPHIGHO2_12_FULL_49_11]|nr:MAG: hypothetical protein A3F09_00660 [Chlamydiae bacterium RIFCSPHIGHO2_12_FULL_49_11]